MYKSLYVSILTLVFLSVALVSVMAQAKKEPPAKQIELQVGLGTPVMLANETQTAYLKVGLTGFEFEQEGTERTPVNVAIVLDRSGSMSGEKMQQAKQAAIMAIDYLNSNDIVSVVTYDDTVEVVVPSTKVTDKDYITRAIRNINVNGSTALFAGVSKGSHEVRKFLSDTRVNRVILLSDGLANVGPSSPRELGDLGRSLGKEGISVTTIGLGLGYNEDLMIELAGNSDGNHTFVENARDLARIFEAEFGDVLSVVAQQVEITIRCADGIRPVRVLGRSADIDGKIVRTQMNQLYSQQEKYILLEVEVPPGKTGNSRNVAEVDVSYRNMLSNKTDDLTQVASVSFSSSKDTVKEKTDEEIITDTVKQIANTASIEAVRLRDEGKIDDAKKLLEENKMEVFTLGVDGRVSKATLSEITNDLDEDAEDLQNEKDWNKNRKKITSKQYRIQNQQKY